LSIPYRNNVRKELNEKSQTNPKYCERMSKFLDELIKQRKQDTIYYKKYLDKIKELVEQVTNSIYRHSYPSNINTIPIQAFL
jgi:type I restriction enzyme R subunit